ncbi:MAG: NAD-binding protein [Bacteroidetes bacterium]|nr:NAD-binding protein [Bacteroidota bacterium]
MFKKLHPLTFWFIVVLAIMLLGVCGFMLIEGFNFFDALYMTVITVTTIGYGETKPLSTAGRLFNIGFIITSFTLFTYSFAVITRYITSGEMKNFLKNRKLMKQVNELNQHVVICGFGRNGQQTARTLLTHKIDFIVIDSRPEMIDLWRQNESTDVMHLIGDATDDTVLKRAGIEKAHSLICALPNDAQNVFVVLSGKQLNPNLKIVSRASNHTSINKLKTAGANSISMPELLGGTFMATQISKPDVIEFIEYLTGDEGESINIESVDYAMLPPEIQGKSLRTIMDWKKTGVTSIGIKEANGKFIINPNDDILITQGMKVIVLGNKQQIDAMKHNVN